MIASAAVRPKRFRTARPSATPAYWAAASFIGLILLANFLFGGEPYQMTGGVGSPIYQISLLATFGSVVLATRFWENPARLLVFPIMLGLALAWCWLSMTWAIAPGVATRRVIQLSILMFGVFVIVRQLGYERTVRLLRWTFAATLALTFVILVVWPDFAIQRPYMTIDQGTGNTVRGLMIDKNANGAFCAITVLLFLFDARSVPRPVRAAVIGAALAMLWLSASKTSMGVLVGVTALGIVLNFYNSAYRVLLIPFMVCLAVVGVMFWHNFAEPFQAALYDPNAFTGRGVIWSMLLRYVQTHWLLGSGYGSFWAIGDLSPVYALSDQAWILDRVRVGHNGYLDLLCQIGAPGLAIVLLATVVLPLVRLFANQSIAPNQIALLASILLFALGNNFTESSLFDGKAILSVILLLDIALIHEIGRPAGKARRGLWSPRFRAHPSGTAEAPAPATTPVGAIR